MQHLQISRNFIALHKTTIYFICSRSSEQNGSWLHGLPLLGQFVMRTDVRGLGIILDVFNLRELSDVRVQGL